MPDRTRAVRTACLVVVVLLAAWAAPAAEKRHRWEVTIALRLTGGNGKPVSVRLAVPGDGPAQRLLQSNVVARGFQTTTVSDGDQPHILLTGRFRGARRIAATFRVERERQRAVVPPVWPLEAPSPEILPFLSPAPLFQSRSILVRDFLQTFAAPVIERGGVDPLRAIFAVTRQELKRRGDGKSLALDVIRRRQGKRIGIERAFTTCLRCVRIPARLVEGIHLTSSTRRKRVFWTEVWADDQWWPVSASQGRMGELPASYIAMARDGTRVVRVDGPATAVYSVHARRLTDAP